MAITTYCDKLLEFKPGQIQDYKTVKRYAQPKPA
jgi:hypothetical protein